jgi:uroporphyrinogen decarboxylase
MEHKKDGIYGMLPKEQMCESALKYRAVYEMEKDAPIFQREFGYYVLDRWLAQGHIKQASHSCLAERFGFDEPGHYDLCGLGWTTAQFFPEFKEEIVETRGEHEVVIDSAGRHVLFFKGRRDGFMPEYLDHPVKDMDTWNRLCKWRLDPDTEGRYADIDLKIGEAKAAAMSGKMITQRLVGGYMYLRSLIGPEGLLYMFYDSPDLIHDCMETWFKVADSIIERHQRHVTIDELFIGEDICYNHGPLISPQMIKEFLFPYYKQLIANIKSRQLDKDRKFYFQVDTDGFAVSVIDLYMELGMNVMSPFEVASGCDVVKIAKKYPELIMTGGIDKRILAGTKKQIDEHIDYIMPFMKKRGGYIPTCDHGVPEEVSFENYSHFRKRLLEFA